VSDALELEALRARLAVARQSHREAVAELERLQNKRGGASAFALDLARQRLETARRELQSARRQLLRPI
jgi:hypothetical protein